ncbi:glycoside hydrolase family 43 protein [Deinococcus sp.]|uniref:glycoside hydrolase family 43 protein n=1 Tax=Deinococcus sp. TaxID=47478 RepID=UPI003C7A8BF7
MKTYTNPVFPDYFADPFVLEHAGTYYAYGTTPGTQQHGVFALLSSPNLTDWTPLGRVLAPLESGWTDYWAPEVAQHGGRFYLYFSAGRGDRGHHLRVAVADHPAGPFTDQNLVLTPDLPFAIDPHPFRDEDGQWYLYYATDLLDGERVGTSLVVQPLRDMLTLEGGPQTVLRASHDWQRYQAERNMYGAVYDWHTLEGPFVVRRGGSYYCFYSGGAWTDPSYGVSYAVAGAPLGPWHEPEAGTPVILKTVTGHVIGPGHNSLVQAPDGETVVVYHAWDVAQTARRLCVDRLDWTPEGPRLRGPTWTPQPGFSNPSESVEW